jgi:hypothetical protein
MPRKDGSPTIQEILDSAKDEDGEHEDEAQPRRGKPWPPEEDCKGCDKHKDGPHRFSCSEAGVRASQLVLPATVVDGKIVIKK